MQNIVIKIGDRKYVPAIDWDTVTGRRGVWIATRSGGWWMRPSLDHALKTCPNPRTYRTWKAANLAGRRVWDK